MRRIPLAFLALLLALAASPARAQALPTVPVVTLDAARKMASAAEAEARRNGWSVAIAVVDASGELVLFQRGDDVQPASPDIAVRKARTAARFRRPTKALEDAVAGGRTVLLSMEGMLPVEGGVPVLVGGRVIGAVGVSGATSPQDAQVARAGVEALAR